MGNFNKYVEGVIGDQHKALESAQVFAKVLTSNDDSGRHGVLIPTDAYSFFPEFQIDDPSQNATLDFDARDSITGRTKQLSYKYYQRYPERRVTRLRGELNDKRFRRIVIFIHAMYSDKSSEYFFDCGHSAERGRFDVLFGIIFGDSLAPEPGVFVVRAANSEQFTIDSALGELLCKFDAIKGRGWVETMRKGDTGIGYTFESLLGIKENNDQLADFRGIEIKCKGVKQDGHGTAGKINLFQSGPIWLAGKTAKDRIMLLGTPDEEGLFRCHSQLTTSANNLGLLLSILSAEERIELVKQATRVGYWPFKQLEKRLIEKHSRTVFIKAKSRESRGTEKFLYDEFVYCDSPNIDRFLQLVSDRNIVFEFLMRQKQNGSVRNHGYPWRLVREEFLESLFGLKIRLR